MTTPPDELVLELLREEHRAMPADEMEHKLGLSPSEVYAAIETLRTAGFSIGYVERTDRHGFILLREPEVSLAAEVTRLLDTQTIGKPLVFRDELDSTNILAMDLATRGASHGTVVLARRQTAGRGRRGREWMTLPGENLTMSVILRPGLPAERAGELTITAAVALAEAIETFGIDTMIKWPNDLELDGKKCAGILCELSADEVGLRHVVMGVGVNVSTPPEAFPADLGGRATSLAASGRNIGVAPLAAAFLSQLEEWLVLHESMGFGAVLDTWRARTSTLGAEVRALIDGKVIGGVAEEIDETGALLVRDAEDKVHRIFAGEVTTLRPA